MQSLYRPCCIVTRHGIAITLPLIGNIFPVFGNSISESGAAHSGARPITGECILPPMTPRVCIIGLDCADPRLVFGQFADDMPTVTGLRTGGGLPPLTADVRNGRAGPRVNLSGPNRGPLRSCHPPITVPAWSVMTSGRDAGELGLYGFRNRRDHSYSPLTIATSLDVHHKRIWDRLNRPGDHSIVVGVPGTYPPIPIRGDMVSGPLAPELSPGSVHPPGLAAEIRETIGDYAPDIAGFRTLDRDRLYDAIREQTRQRFRLFRHLLATRPWTFAMMVEMGTDRMHHAFWRYHDPAHRLHEPGSPWQNAIRDYYRLIDSEIAATLNVLTDSVPPAERDALSLLIVSDHGARALEGGFALNEWLIREGLLTLRSDLSATDLEAIGPGGAGGNSSGEAGKEVPARIPLQPDLIDWSRTRAWGEGGYYGRLWLNIAGREPEGIVAPGDADRLLTELTDTLEALPDDRGKPMGTHCHRPRDLYRECTGVPPDLMIYFGDLDWRSIGTVDRRLVTGDRTPEQVTEAMLYTPGNDLGPDDANHDWEGIVVAAGAETDGVLRHGLPRHIDEVAGWVLKRFGLTARK